MADDMCNRHLLHNLTAINRYMHRYRYIYRYICTYIYEPSELCG